MCIYIYIQNRPYFGFWEVESTQMYIEKSTIICVGIFQQMYQHICCKNKCIYVDSAKKNTQINMAESLENSRIHFC